MASQNNLANGQDASEGLSNVFKILSQAREDITSQTRRVLPDLSLLQDFFQTYLAGGTTDDRKYIVENVIQLAASLSNRSTIRNRIDGAFVSNLWNNLQHPPLSYLGDEFKYRTADGSNNNIMYPRLGASGSRYARTVTPKHLQPSVRPDPSLIFDTLLARTGPAKEHPAKVSSTLFYLATIIIHDLFHSDDQDDTKLKNSSYLDLGPLYGHNKDQQDCVRTFKDGLLKRDTFAESRLIGQPPGACALMIAFNRFHNYVVGELAAINEGGRFSLRPGISEGDSKYAEAQRRLDEDLFQTGRLVTCSLYVNMILNDYLRTILNLNRNSIESDWKLDPRESLPKVFDSLGTPRGIGNQVSVEFNMIYRWHSAISNQDEAWAEGFFASIFGSGVDSSTLSVCDFLQGIRRWFDELPDDPALWTFGGLTRQKDGSFPDAGLVKLLQQGTQNVAGAFGPRNIPKVLKAIEILGIQQGRRWGLATLNELRQFFKLKPYSDFVSINSDKDVAEALEALYGHPDNVELYPGILAEEAKEAFEPGSGLCPGFTISFAILSDAVALVRGDRFYTVDYSPSSLTNFGYTLVNSDFDVAEGGVMYKLLMRAFPGWYRANSVYALYPFTTVEGTRAILQKKGTVDNFDFSEPSFVGPPTPVLTWQGVVDTLNDQKHFKVPWGKHTYQMTQHDYMLSGDAPANAQQRVFVRECLYKPGSALDEVRQFYESTTSNFIHQYARKIGESYQVDIVADIGNPIHANFAGHFFDIPLKGSSSIPGAYTNQELYDALAHLFGYVFLDLDTAKSFKGRVVGLRDVKRMGALMEAAVTEVKSQRFVAIRHMLGLGFSQPLLADYGGSLVSRLSGFGKRVDEVVWTIIPTAAAACATQAQGWAQLIDLYLSDKYCHHWPAIQKLARSDKPEDFEKLKKYALEGFRLSTPAFGVLRNYAAGDATIHDGPRDISVKQGDSIFADFITAGRDSSKFPDPDEIKLDRPDDLYIHHGWGPHACLGRPIVTVAAASMLRVFARLDNLRRAPGPAGTMKSRLVNNSFKEFLAKDASDWGVYPCTKLVMFDQFHH